MIFLWIYCVGAAAVGGVVAWYQGALNADNIDSLIGAALDGFMAALFWPFIIVATVASYTLRRFG